MQNYSTTICQREYKSGEETDIVTVSAFGVVDDTREQTGIGDAAASANATRYNTPAIQ